MSNICPICDNESTQTICKTCGFEMPTFAFLSEEDAKKWYEDTVVPYREAWENNKKKNSCTSCGKEVQENWKLCPFCGTSVEVKQNSSGISSSPTTADIFVGWRLIRTFKGHRSKVTSVAFSPDGNYIVSGSSYTNPTLRLWKAGSKWPIRTFWEKVSRVVYSVAFSPDGKHIVLGGPQGPIELRETESGQLVRIFEGRCNSSTYSVAFSPDGKYIVSGSGDNIYRAFSNLIALELPVALELWEVESGRLVYTYEEGESANSVAFSPDGKHIVSGWSDSTLKLWETESGQHVHTFKGHKGEVKSVAFSSDGKYMISGSFDKTLKLWETGSNRLVRTFKGHESYVNSVAFSPCGSYIISGSRDNTLKLWETGSGQLVHTFEGHKDHVNSVAFSPDSKYIVSGSSDNTLKLWGLVK